MIYKNIYFITEMSQHDLQLHTNYTDPAPVIIVKKQTVRNGANLTWEKKTKH